MWPDGLVARLTEHHPVIRYDHRDTGRSSTTSGDATYGVAELADDAVAMLDAFDVDRAHVLGWGMGGHIAQLLLLDHPERLASATLLATRPLPRPGGGPLPGLPTALRRLWAELDDPRDREGELAWRLTLDRLLHGAELPVRRRRSPGPPRARDGARGPRRAGRRTPTSPCPPGRRVGEPASAAVPTLVIEAGADPVSPRPAERSSRTLGRARLCGSPVWVTPSAGDADPATCRRQSWEHTMSIPTSA